MMGSGRFARSWRDLFVDQSPDDADASKIASGRAILRYSW
jgi:hypothetical protein